MRLPVLRPLCLTAALLSLLSLGGCFSTPTRDPKTSVYQHESFRADETFSRLFDGSVNDTCEAARRALLSQGYVITEAANGTVNGHKQYQPDAEVHVEISFNIVCIADDRSNNIATAYVSAQQDKYGIKKSTSSSSIGVSAIGSISLPVGSTQDSMVKVASETIPAGTFYDRFFALMEKMLHDQAGGDLNAAAEPTAVAAASAASEPVTVKK